MPLPAMPVELTEDRKQEADGPKVSGQGCIGHNGEGGDTHTGGA